MATDSARRALERIRVAAPSNAPIYLIEATYRVEKDGSGTSVYLFGADASGASVGVQVRGFAPFFFVGVEPTATVASTHAFVTALDAALRLTVTDSATRSALTWKVDWGAAAPQTPALV